MEPFSSTELCLTHHHFHRISAGRESRIKHFIAPASSFIGGFSRGMVIVKDKSFVGSRAHENRALDTLRHCRAFPGIRFIMGMHLKTSWNWWFKGICVHFPETEQGLWLCWVLLSGAEVSRCVLRLPRPGQGGEILPPVLAETKSWLCTRLDLQWKAEFAKLVLSRYCIQRGKIKQKIKF